MNEAKRTRGSVIKSMLKGAIAGIAASTALVALAALLLYKQILHFESVNTVNAVIKTLCALLAAFILAGNTIVLSMLVGTFGMNRMLAKIITEALFFVISWTVQKYVIFFSEDEEADAAAAGEEKTA